MVGEDPNWRLQERSIHLTTWTDSRKGGHGRAEGTVFHTNHLESGSFDTFMT